MKLEKEGRRDPPYPAQDSNLHMPGQEKGKELLIPKIHSYPRWKPASMKGENKESISPKLIS